MSQVLGIVVSYNPTDEILHNVTATLEQVSKVIVVDNGSNTSSKKILSQLKDSNKVELIFNDSNKGVAAGFNQGIQWGLENDFQWFLLLDQDSRLTSGMVQELIRISLMQPDPKKIIVGPRHEDFDRKILPEIHDEVQEIPLLITSGSLLSRQLVVSLD